MVKRFSIIALMLLIGVQAASGNHTRMDALMAGDFIDDIIYVDMYPHRLIDYQNNLYLDISTNGADFGIIGTPNEKYGVIGAWQNPLAEDGFNFGYAVSLYKFDLGVSISPNKDNTRLGFGIGREFFDQKVEVAFLTLDGAEEDRHTFRIRYSRRMGDFNIIPRYAVDYISDPMDFKKHKIGLMFQRMILNEGFVYLGAEYDFTRGDIETDSTHIHGGVELRLNRYLAFRCGIVEHFEDSFENGTWYVEPGIGLRIRDFSIDFHLNHERLFDKEQTFFKSFGLDFFFGRF